MAAVRYLLPYLVGSGLEDVGEISKRMDRALYGNHGAKSAVEIALHDALGPAAQSFALLYIFVKLAAAFGLQAVAFGQALARFVLQSLLTFGARLNIAARGGCD